MDLEGTEDVQLEVMAVEVDATATACKVAGSC
jgi:hypothetical protein